MNEMELKKIESGSLEYWALIELMGHGRMVGRVSQAELGDGKLLQIDAINKEGEFVYSRFLSASAIYAINPVSREAAIEIVKNGYGGHHPIFTLSFNQLKAELRKELEDQVTFLDQEDDKPL